MPHEITHTCGQGASPPCEDDPRTPKIVLRSQGLLALAFGFALGITFMIFFGFFKLAKLYPSSKLAALFHVSGEMSNFVSDLGLKLWMSFLYGFIGGIAIAVVYNILVVRRL